MFTPGRVLQSLYFIGGGVVSYTREDEEGKKESFRLETGNHFGEIGLLAGAPRVTAIAALTPVIAYELAKADLAPILEARPDVAQELSRALARRQAAGRSIAASEMDHTMPTSGLTGWFSERIRRLYNAASAP